MPDFRRPARTSVVVALAIVTALLLGPASGAVETASRAGQHSAPAPTVAGWDAKPFAKKWARKATQRDWGWIRRHSVMADGHHDSGVRISEIRWFLGMIDRVRMGTCAEAYEPSPRTRMCWGANAENILVKRQRSGREVVLSFWVED